jgi:hypothetical protein
MDEGPWVLDLGLVRLALNPCGLSEFKSQASLSSSKFFLISYNPYIMGIHRTRHYSEFYLSAMFR